MIKTGAVADDTREVNVSLGVCPTCAWPMVTDIGECVHCSQPESPGSGDAASLARDADINRSVTGQMPAMLVFSETQQASSAERRRKVAWREAENTFAKRRSKPRSYRLPTVLAGLIVIGLLAAFFVLRGDGTGELTDSTPSDDLPWRIVTFSPSSTVELPGAPVVSVATSEIGDGTRVATSIPGAAVAVSSYRADYGMRGAGAVAVGLLQTRAGQLGDPTAASRVKQTRDRWGDAYDVSVIAGQPVARLRVIVVGSTLYLIEVVGPQTDRATQIFSRIVNTLVPKV